MRRYRVPIALATLDLSAWPTALLAAAWLRYEFGMGPIDTSGWAIAAGVAIAAHAACGMIAGLYRGRHRLASFEEVTWLAVCSASSTAVLLAAVALASQESTVPAGVAVSAGAFQLLAALGGRLVLRTIRNQRLRSSHQRSHRVLVFGAGDAGFRAVQALLVDPQADLLPVAYLDDDPAKARLRLHGLPVVGGVGGIVRSAAAYQADTLLIAMPSASRNAIAEVADEAQRAGLAVKILPRMAKYLTHGRIETEDIREMRLSDFLGREEAQLDVHSIAGYLEGKVVLVTGAGGSIGSALCAEVLRYDPARLVMVDNSENALHGLQLRLEGRALLQDHDLILADIRERDTVRRIFDDVRPDVVFHTAARKHVSFLERFPHEAVKTNVLGTLNVLEAALAADVARFVNISTDKAADPVNVLGLTKQIGEMLTVDFARRPGGAGFMSVRFGNVLGSEGSVIPIFREQIASDAPITVTHPDVTRYFMTVEEAVRLVVQGGAIGGDGDVFVLDMGEPVKIVDLARRLSAEMRPGSQPRIEVVGLRPGEKLHETPFSDDDIPKGRPHPLIWRFGVAAIGPDEARNVDLDAPTEALVASLERAVEAARLEAAFSARRELADRLDD